jgi:hypothetical protein
VRATVLAGIGVVAAWTRLSCSSWCAGSLSATGGCQAAGPIPQGVFHFLDATAVLVVGLVLLVHRGRARSGPLRGQ